LGALLAYPAIGAVLVQRFTRSAEQEQRLATEMKSARQIQAQLVPLDFPSVAGFQIVTNIGPTPNMIIQKTDTLQQNEMRRVFGRVEITGSTGTNPGTGSNTDYASASSSVGTEWLRWRSRSPAKL
jgi:hypothetical protein